MISFKAFIAAVHEAILSANQALMDQNEGLIDRYFDRDPAGPAGGEGEARLKAKSVVVEYPHGSEMVGVHVPLVTLVPLSMSQIDTVKLTLDFQAMIRNQELHLVFPGERKFRRKSSGSPNSGRLEITMAPTETASGLQELVDGYEKALKAQMPH